jgi:hypothetical protein
MNTCEFTNPYEYTKINQKAKRTLRGVVKGDSKNQNAKIKMQNDNVKCKKKSLEFVIWNLFVIWCLELSHFAAACFAEGIFTFHLHFR